MPIMSYLAWPVTGKKEALIVELQDMPGCDIQPAVNQDVIVLVTNTDHEQQERELQEALKEVKELACLALVSGYSDPELSNGG